jgi:hypothetical protein
MGHEERIDSVRGKEIETETNREPINFESLDTIVSSSDIEAAERIADSFPSYSIVGIEAPDGTPPAICRVDTDGLEVHLHLRGVGLLSDRFVEHFIDYLRVVVTPQLGVKSFDDIVGLLDLIADHDDWAVRFAMLGDEYKLDDGTSIWMHSPDGFSDTFALVGNRERYGLYRLRSDQSVALLRNAINPE